LSSRFTAITARTPPAPQSSRSSQQGEAGRRGRCSFAGQRRTDARRRATLPNPQFGARILIRDAQVQATPLSDDWDNPEVLCIVAGPDGPHHFFAGCRQYTLCAGALRGAARRAGGVAARALRLAGHLGRRRTSILLI
jgi:hypothetical protein